MCGFVQVYEYTDKVIFFIKAIDNIPIKVYNIIKTREITPKKKEVINMKNYKANNINELINLINSEKAENLPEIFRENGFKWSREITFDWTNKRIYFAVYRYNKYDFDKSPEDWQAKYEFHEIADVNNLVIRDINEYDDYIKEYPDQIKNRVLKVKIDDKSNINGFRVEKVREY